MSAAADSITITLNGDAARVPAGSSLLALVERLGRDPRAVAVEHNGEIVARAAYGERELREGDRLEVVGFVQGG
ncbi:MAG TPA: sulfur carrier protein ThiS [Thermoanaerobaculia bacterium]|jgi:thiamine biosynthesis protein ThiS